MGRILFYPSFYQIVIACLRNCRFKIMTVRIIHILFIAVTSILISCSVKKAENPNIIFILTDDQRWDALGYAGNNIIQTPEMDRLAKEGVYFKNAFVTTPICVASRASILNSLRVPMMIYDPRNKEHKDVNEMALNIDIPATILDLAGIDKPEMMQGKSLVGFLLGENPLEDRESFICEHLWETPMIPPSEGIRTKKWKYFRYRNDLAHEELYDLEKDQLEIVNLKDSSSFQKVLEDLRMKTDSISNELTEAKMAINF
jgi:arylsulfatase A-like enzyme